MLNETLILNNYYIYFMNPIICCFRTEEELLEGECQVRGE